MQHARVEIATRLQQLDRHEFGRKPSLLCVRNRISPNPFDLPSVCLLRGAAIAAEQHHNRSQAPRRWLRLERTYSSRRVMPRTA